MVVDEAQVVLGVEVLHGDDRGAEAVDGEAEAQRSCMVEGRRRQIALRVVDAEEQLQHRQHRTARGVEFRVRGTGRVIPLGMPVVPDE